MEFTSEQPLDKSICLLYTCTTESRILLKCMEPLHNIQAEKKIEMVQRRVSRCATDIGTRLSSLTDMLEDLNRDTLETSRAKAQWCSKIVNL